MMNLGRDSRTEPATAALLHLELEENSSRAQGRLGSVGLQLIPKIPKGRDFPAGVILGERIHGEKQRDVEGLGICPGWN